MTLFYSIEGHAFAGKTTLVRHLEQHYGFSKIGEYDSFVQDTNDYPPHPHKTPEVAKQDVDFFVELDLKRENQLRELQTSDLPVIMDRTFLSLILFQKYTRHLNRKNEYNSYEYAKQKYHELLNSGILSVPDFMIYLTPENLDVHTSRLTREISSDLLRSVDAYTFFNQEYSAIFKVYANRGRLLSLVSNNTKENLNINAQRVNGFKKETLNPIEQSNLIEEIFKII